MLLNLENNSLRTIVTFLESRMSDQPRLSVPTLRFVDKTPTPTRLLKAVDEIGLQLDSAKSTASSTNNPFDEHFRKALTSSKAIDDVSSSVKTDVNQDDMLNTPLILPDIQSAPPTANVIPLASTATTTTATTKSTKFKPIVPMTKPVMCSTSSATAQLLLKMPSGTTLQLSQIPFIKESVKETGRGKKTGDKKKTLSESDTNDLKARNRAAASRARQKKKKLTEGFQKQIQILTEKNKQLMQENSLLKKEVVQLKNQIDINKTTATPVIITLDQNFVPGAVQPPQ